VRRAAAFGLAVFTASSFTAPAFGAGLGASPDSIEIATTREGTQTATLIIFVDGANIREVDAIVIGDAASWLSVDQTDRPPGFDRIVVGEDGRATVSITATVPADAPNGEHTAAIEVTASDQGADIITSVLVPVIVAVTGDAVVSGTADLVAPAVVAEESPVPILASVTNTGTVIGVPVLAYTITSDDAIVANGTATGDAIKPGGTTEVRLEADHPAQAGSTVIVDVVVTINNTVIATSSHTIDVVDAGTASGGVTDVSLEVAESAGPGGVARVVASLSNSGPSDLATVFRAEITRDGLAIGEIESIRLLVAPGTTASVDLFVPIETDGTYEVSGRWEGQAPSSEDVTLSWTVGSAAPVSLLLAAAIISIVIIGLIAVRFRRGSSPSSRENDPVMEEVPR
jgi:hypothetical protein